VEKTEPALHRSLNSGLVADMGSSRTVVSKEPIHFRFCSFLCQEAKSESFFYLLYTISVREISGNRPGQPTPGFDGIDGPDENRYLASHNLRLDSE